LAAAVGPASIAPKSIYCAKLFFLDKHTDISGTPSKPRRFLIGQLARYGDCLYATTIAKQIKKDHPNSHVTWAVAENFKSILYLNPHVDAVWPVPIIGGDYYLAGWKNFETEALRRKAAGEFDEIIFSQVAPLNWINYTGTIRGTILSAYKKPITVNVSPVLQLSAAEVENVRGFATANQLGTYKNVILFECMPGSGQSNVNPAFAVRVAKDVISQYPDTCFILSSQSPEAFPDPRILSAASLSFRENAELTKYCTLLIGCSSGITWVATSDWAKKIPMLQLFSAKPSIYAGVHHDFELNGLDTGHILEIKDDRADQVVEVISSIFTNEFAQVKARYHQKNVPGYRDFKKIVEQLVKDRYPYRAIMDFARRYVARSIEDHAPLYLNFAAFGVQLGLSKINRELMDATKPVKRVLKKKKA